MDTWFQDLNENKKKLFHFRGVISKNWHTEWFRYEVVSGPCFDFIVEPYRGSTNFIFGFFFIKLYLTISFMNVIPFLTKARRYGFKSSNFGEPSITFCFGDKAGFDWDSTKRNRYHQMKFKPITFIFGKLIHFTEELRCNYAPVHFKFRGELYQMDTISIGRLSRFRSRVPFGLWHEDSLRLELKIANPPHRAGKGENSWDCGDDATYGMSCPYEGPEVKGIETDGMFEWCIRKYCEGVFKDIQRYGRASGNTYPKDDMGFEYLSYYRDPNPSAVSCGQDNNELNQQ